MSSVRGVSAPKRFLPESAGRVALLLSCLVPLVRGSELLFPYVTPKALLFRLGVGCAAGVVLWMVGRRVVSVSDARDPVLWSLVAYALASSLSAALGPAPHHSFFGDLERMWGVAQWWFLIAFYCALRVLFAERTWRTFWRCTLYVALSVAALAGFEFLLSGMGPGSWSTGVDGTLGNTGYLGAYMVLAIGTAFLAVEQLGGASRWMLPGAAVGIFSTAAYLSANRASLLGLLAALVIVSGILAYSTARRSGTSRPWIYTGGLLVGATVAALWLVGPSAMATGSRVLSGTHEAVVIGGQSLLARFEGWEAAIEGFHARPVIGWGPENFNLVYDRFVDPVAYRLSKVAYDRAHNVLLGNLVESGPVGLLAYLSVWGSLVALTIRGWWTDRFGLTEAAGFLIAFCGYFVYLQAWFEDHSSAALLVATAAYLRHRYTGGRRLLVIGRETSLSGKRAALWGVACAGLLGAVAWPAARTALAAHRMYQGRAASGLRERIHRFEQARRLGIRQQSDVAVRYAAEMGRLGLTSGSYLGKSDSLRTLYRRGVGGAEQALSVVSRRQPMNGRLDAVHGRLAGGAGVVYPGEAIREDAARSMRRAFDKSPPILEHRHMLGGIYAAFSDLPAARATLREALGVYDGYGRTYYLLSQRESGTLEPAALRRLREAFWLGYFPDDGSYLQRGVRQLVRSGQASRAEGLLSVYFASRYLPALRTVRDRFEDERAEFIANLDADLVSREPRYRDYRISSGDLALLAHWPRAAVEAGQCQRATLAIRLLINGLSTRSGTADLTGSLARKIDPVRRRCRRSTSGTGEGLRGEG